MTVFAASYAAAYQTLTKAEPITCAETSTTFEAVPTPSAIIVDFLNLPQRETIRKLTGYSTPIIAWIPCGISYFIRLWGPESLGGLGDFGAKVDAEVLRTGTSLEDVANEILSHASPFAQVSAELSKKVNASKLGLLAAWSPQQFILNHQATGWFFTHGGHGGVTESLSSGIPLIFWPFKADQPTAAAHVAENLKAGIELFEVRTGRGLQPIHRNGKIPKGTREAVGEEIRRVLDICGGKEGAEMRRNAEMIKAEMKKSWEEGGPAKLAMRQFLQDYA
ncbi:hypothetical protein H0H81_011178 [Sphagnurus paluster]|uniref:UDP-Glycosyltransferase/glycogen phosphorylase n=1 Tax=Sphagnurus paluster TaxID=117069 RepID=A0A9P7GHK1_9AGAR|nr:hypothetical protein H0H81_011178 [Sphagnurus paluster]